MRAVAIFASAIAAFVACAVIGAQDQGQPGKKLDLSSVAKAAVPVTIKAQAGKIARLNSTFAGETEWWIADERLRGDEYVENIKPLKRLIVVPPAAGRYLILAVAAVDNRPMVQEFVLVVEGPAPPPSPPDPPTPPPPVDPFVAKMRAAYTQDRVAGNGGEPERLILVRGFNELASFVVTNTSIQNVGHVGAMTKVALKDMPAGSLPTVKTVVGQHIVARVPEANTIALTDEIRGRFSAAFKEIAAALEASK